MRFRNDVRPVRLPLLLGLLLVDAVFVALHLAHKGFDNLFDNRTFGGRRWSITADNSYSEMFQYGKEAVIAALFLGLLVRTREIVYASWMVLFAFFLVDDSQQFHERAGGFLADELDLPSMGGVRDQDLGELLVVGCVGALFALLLAWGYFRAARPARVVSIQTGLMVAVLAGFGVVVDLVHRLAEWKPLNVFFAVLEDGGEMVAMSAIVWLAAVHYREPGAPLLAPVTTGAGSVALDHETSG